MSDRLYRRLMGLVLGVLLGVGYGLVSQTINAFFLPGLPLEHPPLGVAGNIAAITAAMALLGVISAWPDNGIIGVLIGSTSAAVPLVLDSVLRLRAGPEIRTGVILISLFAFLLPLIALIVPGMSLLRWAANKQAEARHDGWPALARLPLPLVLLLIVGATGAFSLYRSDARVVLRRMEILMQEGRGAQGSASLPQSLRAEEVGDFAAHARSPYTLAWEKDDENRYRIPRPITDSFDQSVAIARFTDGFTLACLFPTPIDEPTCRQFP